MTWARPCRRLTSGASFSFTMTKAFTSTLPHTAYVFADYGCVVTEDNKTNNLYGPITFDLKPANRPDLVVESVTATPINPAAGQAIQLRVRVKNQGLAATIASSTVGIYTDHEPLCDDAPFTDVVAPALAAGTSFTFTTTASFPTGGQHTALRLRGSSLRHRRR